MKHHPDQVPSGVCDDAWGRDLLRVWLGAGYHHYGRHQLVVLGGWMMKKGFLRDASPEAQAFALLAWTLGSVAFTITALAVVLPYIR